MPHACVQGRIHDIRERGSKRAVHVIVTDGDDPRCQEAVKQLLQDTPNMPLRITLLSHGDAAVKETWVRNSNIHIVAPMHDPHLRELADAYRNIRIRAGKVPPSQEDAYRAVSTNEIYAAMLLVTGRADGMLGGASVPTARVLQAGLQIVGLKPGRSVVSGAFAMLFREPLAGGQAVVAFADCAVVPVPTARQLMEIALNTSEIMRDILRINPVIAFLSFSTKRSAKHDSLEKIQEAVALVRETQPELIVDGELQADAALVPEVAWSKDPGGVIDGHANVLIFPDLNAANISYKLVQRTSGSTALGVVLSGFAKPVNDMSRGCTADDIADMICVTSLQAGDPR